MSMSDAGAVDRKAVRCKIVYKDEVWCLAVSATKIRLEPNNLANAYDGMMPGYTLNVCRQSLPLQ